LSTTTPISLEQAQSLYKKPDYSKHVSADADKEEIDAYVAGQKNVALAAREQAIVDEALALGVKAGLAWRLSDIERVVNARARDLDTYYNFGPLMVESRVVPPVIAQARDLYNQDGDYALRLSGEYNKIVSQAKFSSTAPNWRSYLTFVKPVIDMSATANMLRPKTDDEIRLFQHEVAQGWKQGEEQATRMFEYALDRLNRDYVGMIRYHEFVLQKRITQPVVATSTSAVTQEGSTLVEDETLLRLMNLPGFNANSVHWTSIGALRETPDPVARAMGGVAPRTPSPTQEPYGGTKP
jgi:defect-in-organelle-trafficking protein DotC